MGHVGRTEEEMERGMRSGEEEMSVFTVADEVDSYSLEKVRVERNINASPTVQGKIRGGNLQVSH